MDALTRATNEINRALQRLEQETGRFVESVEVRSIEVTRFDSAGPEFSRTVVIELKPIPGSLWEVR